MGMTFNNRDNRELNKGTDFARGVMGNKKYVEFEFNTVANSTPAYAAGGILLAHASVGNSKFGLATVSHCEIEAKGGFVFNYDIGTDKILMWQSDNGGASVMVEEQAGAPAAVSNIKGMAWGHD
jgi:hypothetical protein